MAPQGPPAFTSPASTSATAHDSAAARSAALRGATLAFQAQKSGVDNAKPAPRAPNPTTRGNGALLAATHASREQSSPRTRSPTNTSRKNNGQSRDISRQGTGGSVQDAGTYGSELEHGAVSQRLTQYLSSSPASLRFLSPGGRPSMDQKSPSFIAATLAASRSASPSPNHTGHASPYPPAGHSPLGPPRARRGQSFGANSVDSFATNQDILDTSPIPPATSLISMFEHKTDTDPVKKRDPSPEQRHVARPKLRLPTPPRSLSPRGQDSGYKAQAATPKLAPKPKSTRTRPASPPQIIRCSATEMVSPDPRRLGPKPNLLPSEKLANPPDASNPRHPKPATPKKAPELSKNTHPVEVTRPSVTSSPNSESSDDTFVSASSTQSPRPSSPVRGRERPARETEPPRSSPRPSLQRSSPVRQALSAYSYSPGRGLSPNHSTTTVDTASSLPLDSLTSAIMAGNLASARHAMATHDSPTPPAPPPPRRSGGHHHHHPLHLRPPSLLLHQQHSGTGRRKGSNSKSKSPQRRGMLQTLRQPPASPSRRGGSADDNNNNNGDDDDGADDSDARRRRHRHRPRALGGGGKRHAHHEGSRKRWRDGVSARERRRYEAVWASNRGLFLGDEEEGAADLVANVVVRDIWERSRLPEDELAEVWDLVDRGGGGALDKQEFVVGMWLVDQRLRGRKIPSRVSVSVWDSARGVRVVGPKRK